MHIEEQVAHFARIGNLLNTLILLGKHLSLYSEDNRLVATTTARLQLLLEGFFAEIPRIDIVVARHGFLHEGEFVQRNNKLFEKFALRMFEHGIASFSLTPDLSPIALYSFLRVVLRRPSETWEEGGVSLSMSNRKVVGILVEEMAEETFTLTEQGENQLTPGDKSDLWDRFALSIAHSCGDVLEMALDQSETPGQFAATVSRFMGGKSQEEKQSFAKELSRFLSSMQHEKVQIYQTQALEKLAEFINNLSDELREMFMQNVFNLRLKADYAEGFFSELSDEMILEALKTVSLKKNYVPPVLMSLIGKLAGERELVSPDQLPKSQGDDAVAARKIQELFKPDEFKKYVPSRYQKALMTVLKSEGIPPALDKHLEELKYSLENSGIEEHAAEITLFILKNDPDAEHLDGVRGSLFSSIEHYLDEGDYTNLAGLCRLCFADQQGQNSEQLLDVRELLSADTFIQRLLRDARKRGKQDYKKIAETISTIGEPFITPLLELVADESNRNVRLFFLGCLKELGGNVIAEATERLQDERWFVVRNIIFLLNELDAEAMLPKVRPLMKHPHPKVRQEALKTCVRMHDKAADGILLTGLDSGNDDDVLNAIMLTPFSGSKKVVAKVIELLAKKGLIDYHLGLKKAAVRTLAGMQYVAVLPTYQDILSSRNLLHPICHAKLKLEIVKALGKFTPEAVKGILEEQVEHGSKELAQQAQKLLARKKGAAHAG